MYRIVPMTDAKSVTDAIEASGYRLDQLARLTKLSVNGSLEGQSWVIIPEFEVLEEKDVENIYLEMQRRREGGENQT